MSTTKHIHREPLTSDVIFKAVFGKNNKSSEKALVGLLNMILERKSDPIVSLEYRNPFSIKDAEKDKMVIMDICAEADSGELIDLEVQVEVSPAYINRSLYYGCKLMNTGLESGDDYVKIKKTIVISFLKRNVFPEISDFHTTFMLKERRHDFALTDLLEIHYLELGKIKAEKKPLAEMTPLEKFCAYLVITGDEKEQSRLEELIRHGDEVIAMTDTLLKEISADEKVKALKISREKWLMDQTMRIMDAKEEGKREGIAEGIEREKLEVAKNMLAKGMSLEDIAEITGLSRGDIEALK